MSRNPKTQRSKRALAAREPKLVENVKKSLVLKGPSSSQVITSVLKDMHKLKQPESKMFSRRNLTRPFEDASSVEFLGSQNDCSLFAYGSNSKKRRHNLVLGRLFDFQLLDMLEMGVDGDTFKPMQFFSGKRKALVRMGSKPMMVFNGDEFETNDDLALLKNLLLDYFRGDVLPKINLAGLDTVIVTTAANGKVYFRVYGIALKKSGNKFPRVEMEEVGPRMDLTLRRRKSAASELRKHAMKVPYAAKPKQQKNTRTGQMGAKVGKIFMESQNLTELALTKPKALKRRGRGSGEGEESSPSKKQRK